MAMCYTGSRTAAMFFRECSSSWFNA